MPRLRTLTLGALLAAALTASLGLPGNAWTRSFKTKASKVEPVPLLGTSNTIAGPASFTDDTANPDQNVIYETFGGVAVDVCLTIQNRGAIGDVKTVVNGSETGDRVKTGRTRSRCFTAPTSIELQCTSSLCDVVWRIDAV